MTYAIARGVRSLSVRSVAYFDFSGNPWRAAIRQPLARGTLNFAAARGVAYLEV